MVSVKEIPACLVPLTVAQIKGATWVWVSDSIVECTSASSVLLQEEGGLLKKFAYFEIESAKDLDVPVSLQETLTLEAERYGGSNIGINGGGGRTCFAGEFQLKGIGRTPLVGAGSDYEHAYGGLDLPWAVIEALYSHLTNKIMPLGAVGVVALIYVADKIAIHGGQKKKYPGVILVRNACVRPAHFIRSPFFQANKAYAGALPSDVARVKRANKELFLALGSHEQVIAYFKKFLQGSASQQAFAAMARLSHGGLTPSNISMEGKWLDVPMAGFVNAGVNYCRSEPFYDELRAPLNFGLEALLTYCKYNKIALDDRSFVNFYEKEIELQLTRHFEFIIGIPYSQLRQKMELESWQALANEALKIIYSDKSIGYFKPELKDVMSQDRLHCWLEAIFLILSPNCAQSLTEIFKKLIYAYAQAPFNFDKISNAIYTLFDFANNRNKTNFYDFCKFIALKTLKKSYLSKLFYSSAVEHIVLDMYDKKGVDGCSTFLREAITTVDWVYDGSDSSCTIFSNGGVAVEYYKTSSCYELIESRKGLTEKFDALVAVIDRLSEFDDDVRYLYGFDLLMYLRSLSEVIAEFERV